MKKLTILMIMTVMALGLSAAHPDLAMGDVTISSASNQSLNKADGEKDAATITITDNTPGSVTTAGGLRIQIPATLGAQWAGVDFASAVTKDSGSFVIHGAHLLTWDLNMNAGTLTLHFDSAVSAASFSAGSVTIQNAQAASPSIYYILTDSTTASPDGANITINLSTTDLNGIKAVTGLAKSQATSYLAITTAAFTDTATPGYPIRPVTGAAAKNVTSYTDDATAPALSSWTLDMNAHTLTLTFGEPIDVSTLIMASLKLQNMPSGATKNYNLTDSTTASADGVTVVVTLSTTDFGALVDYSGGGLCAEAINSYLTMSAGAVKDMAGVNIVAIIIGMPVLSYAGNTVTPTQFGITKLENDAHQINDGVAGTPINIAIKGYDASGYRALDYAGDQTLAFSGAGFSPDPSMPPTATNNLTPPIPIPFATGTVVTFAGGKGSSTIKLYNKAVATPSTIKVLQGTIDTSDAYGLQVTVNPDASSKLAFTTEPSSSGIVNSALAQQPVVEIRDQYGNRTSGTNTITLNASTSENVYAPIAGLKIGTSSTVTAVAVDGIASFTGVKYTQEGLIYLYASTAGTITSTFSAAITCSVVKELMTSSVTAGISSTASSIAQTAVFAFKIADGGTDGLDGKINKIVINRSNADETANWTSYIASATLSDGITTPLLGIIGASDIAFGETDSITPIYTVPNGLERTYTLRVTLKSPLPSGADGKVVGFIMDANTDITRPVSSGGSKFPDDVAPISASPAIAVVATNLVIAGTGTMNAGDIQTITITAKDANGNTDKDYADTVSGKNIKFSGATSALDEVGTVPLSGGVLTGEGIVYAPACTNYDGTYTSFGSSTWIKFVNGVSSSSISMKLFKAENAVIVARDDVEGQISSGSGRLTVVVSGVSGSQIAWSVQPKALAVANAPWAPFKVRLVDVYGNPVSGGGNMTIILPDGISLSPGASDTATASSGVAEFNNFAVKATSTAGDAYPTQPFKITAMSNTGATLQSGFITLAAKYTLKVNLVADMTRGNAIPAFKFLIKDSAGNSVGEESEPIPPFTVDLPYGTYSLTFTKSPLYIPVTINTSMSASGDGVDGTYDNTVEVEAWMTSLEESTADYRVMSSFVYDETLESLSVRLWLERRGKIIVNSDTNKLGVATIEVYKPNETQLLPSISIAKPDPAVYTTIAATYKTTVPNILSSNNLFNEALESGKTYFVKCKISYGGDLGNSNSYESGAIFTVTVTQKLSSEIIGKMGDFGPGQTLASKLSVVSADVAGVGGAVSGVSSAVSAVSTKVDTSVAAVAAKVDTVGAQVAATDANVSNVQSAVGVIGTDVSTTLPAKVKTELEKGVISQMLTRNTILREDDSVKIRYRTATGLAPKLTIYKPEPIGTVLSDYDGVKMTEIKSTGIYEYEVTARDSWGIGDFTVVCSEATKNSTDSMVLTIKALYTAGAGVEESVDAVGEAVSKVYTRQKSMEGLLGNPADTKSTSTILGKVNGLNTTVDSLNLTTVSSDAKNARQNAQNVYNEIEKITKGIADVKEQAAALKELSKQLEEMKLNLRKTSDGLAAETAASGTATAATAATTTDAATVSVGTTTITTAGGTGDTTIVNQYVTTAPTAASPRYSSYRKNYAPGMYRTKVSVSEGAVSVADYDMNGIIASTEKRLFDGQSSTVIGRIGKALEALKAQAAGAGAGAGIGTGTGSGSGGAKESDVKDLSNRLEELTALVSVLSRMIETTTNKPIVEGWFEQS